MSPFGPEAVMATLCGLFLAGVDGKKHRHGAKVALAHGSQH
jgi:hypothetical protein